MQERGCPGPFLRGTQSRAGFTHSSFLLLQLSLPPMFLPLILRGLPETRRWHLHCSRQIPRVSCGPLPSWVCHLPLAGALLAFFSQDIGCWSLGPQNSPTPQGSTEAWRGCLFFPASCRFTVTSVPDCRFGQWDCPWALGDWCRISCYFRQWWRSRTWPCPSSWRNGDVRAGSGGISIGAFRQENYGNAWFPRVRWVQDYLW